MANDDHVAQLLKGAANWNAWRNENPDIFPDLGGANLAGAHLIKAVNGADLRNAALWEANLIGADLISANLSGAKLILANLRGADIRKADLAWSASVALAA